MSRNATYGIGAQAHSLGGQMRAVVWLVVSSLRRVGLVSGQCYSGSETPSWPPACA